MSLKITYESLLSFMIPVKDHMLSLEYTRTK